MSDGVPGRLRRVSGEKCQCAKTRLLHGWFGCGVNAAGNRTSGSPRSRSRIPRDDAPTRDAQAGSYTTTETQERWSLHSPRSRAAVGRRGGEGCSGSEVKLGHICGVSHDPPSWSLVRIEAGSIGSNQTMIPVTVHSANTHLLGPCRSPRHTAQKGSWARRSSCGMVSMSSIRNDARIRFGHAHASIPAEQSGVTHISESFCISVAAMFASSH